MNVTFISQPLSIISFKSFHQSKCIHRRKQNHVKFNQCRIVMSDKNISNSNSQVCSYCGNETLVECPACDGRGYHGRTITCYYCHGKKQIECPLCTDDVYKYSYTAQLPETQVDQHND